MSTKNRLSRALSLVLPSGAIGASVLLALSSAKAVVSPTPPADTNPEQPGVAARLQAIRAGVAEIATPSTGGSAQTDPPDSGGVVPTWWGNGGWGRWHPGWGNGGWRWGWHNGGWGNGGWPNGWHNGWHNWGNGWHNYWHNA
jgi:rSAM-associated Gly-rich repeat protein